MHSKLVRGLLRAAWYLELAAAVVILAVTVAQMFLVGESTLRELLAGRFDLDGFFVSAMTIVVGVEFVKMLLLHSPRAVTDVLLFAIARQLVVSHTTSLETLLGVAAVALIFIIKKFLHTQEDDGSAAGKRPPETPAH